MAELTASRRCILGTWLITSGLCLACKMQVPEGEFVCESSAQCPEGWSCLETEQGSRCYSALDRLPRAADGGPGVDASPPEDGSAPQPNQVDGGDDDMDAGGGGAGRVGANATEAGATAAGSGGAAGTAGRAGGGPISGMGGAGTSGRAAAGSGGSPERCGPPGSTACSSTGMELRVCGDDGAWGASYACGSACSANRCTPILLAMNQKGVQGFALDATNIYWSTNEGFIRKLAQTGGQPIDLVTGASNPAGLAVNKTSLFYAQVQVAGAIWRFDLAATSKSVVLAPGQAAPQAVVLDATRAYWPNHVASGSIMAVPLAGGTPVALATQESGPISLAVDATTAYWTNYEGGSVRKIALTGTGATALNLATLQSKPFGIRLDDTHVYWATGGGEVWMVAKSGGQPAMIATGTSGAIAVDGRYLYVSSSSGIEKISIATRVRSVLVDPPATKTAREIAAITTNALYWLEFEAGRVMKVAK